MESLGHTRQRRVRLTATAALIGAFAFATASAAASANSLVYVKGGEPYISAGKNSFALAKIHHRTLPAGRYLLRITADGKPHTLSFTVRPR